MSDRQPVQATTDSRLVPTLTVSDMSGSGSATLTITVLPLYGDGETWRRLYLLREPARRPNDAP